VGALSLQRAFFALSFLCVFGLSSTARATQETLTLVSWNLEHAMSVSEFERWHQFCAPHAFSDTLAIERGHKRPSNMTYCTAHAGTGWPPRKTIPPRGKSACPSASLPVQDLAAHVERQRSIRAVIAQLAATADVFLFQEVIDAQAVRELFDSDVLRDFTVLNLHDVLPSTHAVPQLLAVAVRTRLVSKVSQEAYLPLAQTVEPGGHRLRPGQVVHMQLKSGVAISLLNVHLKAGCNQFDMQDPWAENRRNDPDQPGQTCDAYGHPPGAVVLTQRQQRIQACTALRRQLEPLEAWIDGNAREKHFIVAGDFNRRLHWELSSKRGPARLNDAPANAAFDDATVRLVWPEINDGTPSTSRMRLALTQGAGNASSLGCQHLGIDHFMVSETLAGRQSEHLSALELVALSAGKDQIRLSDHCPHRLKITLPAR
jgi:endonuclease/exonuclease/phosphatase family metal-dependent hydrolase